jgi:hypothetical protein
MRLSICFLFVKRAMCLCRPFTKKQQEELGLGLLYSASKDHREGLEACEAVEALVEMMTVETILNTFLKPLQGDAVKAEVCYTRNTPADHFLRIEKSRNQRAGARHCRVSVTGGGTIVGWRGISSQISHHTWNIAGRCTSTSFLRTAKSYLRYKVCQLAIFRDETMHRLYGVINACCMVAAELAGSNSSHDNGWNSTSSQKASA